MKIKRQKKITSLSKKFVLPISIVTLSVIISSCAMFGGYSTPSYYEYKEQAMDQNGKAYDIYKTLCSKNYQDGTDLDKKVCDARTYATFKIEEYKKAYKNLKLTNTFLFDLPLIGLATATAATAIFSNNTDLIAGLAIGTAGATGLRTYFNNNAKAPPYLKGENADQCILNNSYIFLNSEDGINELQFSSGKLDQTIRNAKFLRESILSSNMAEASNMLVQNNAQTRQRVVQKINAAAEIKKNLDTAIENAEKAETNANKAVGVIKLSDTLIISSVDSVDLKVRGLIQNIDSKVDLDSILKSISKSTKKEEPPKDEKMEMLDLGSQSARTICTNNLGDINKSTLLCILELQSQTTNINTNSAEYISFAENISKCPDEVK